MMEYSVTQEVSRNENENVPTIEVSLRGSQREKRHAISNDYEVYLNECDYDVGLESDPTSYYQAINSENSTPWIYAMEEHLKSMKDNEVWDIVELPKGIKTIGCKWIFKTKHDSKGNVERYKTRLVAKGYTQKEGINYKETFSPISKKDFLRIVMTLVAHFDLELHQMDVKTAFLNDDLHEEVYMDQLKGFQDKGKAHMVWDLFCEFQCPKNDLEKKQMDKIPYAYAVGSIMYAQVCTRPDIAYVVGLLGRYQSNPGIDIWKVVKKVLSYLQGTKDYMLTYRRTDNLEIIGYFDSDYTDWLDHVIDSIMRPLRIYCDNSVVV
ncbi:Retrovirus-related Pol polyprotein from transposon TNT 1-94 [Vitis vinifera]|uniref:Retrovirus-related Pol polyprotein from transposon TNT 1-94 n=1 Tax=Vitis vinifera TaxID=29760 RepID=A0A438KHI2_VITVI|nr:Retrovirus-related Pol polyprotein from transposon TNT 1-94 [Vitis vinifera]